MLSLTSGDPPTSSHSEDTTSDVTTSVDVTSTPTSESEEPSGTSNETTVPGKVKNVRIENHVLI